MAYEEEAATLANCVFTQGGVMFEPHNPIKLFEATLDRCTVGLTPYRATDISTLFTPTESKLTDFIEEAKNADGFRMAHLLDQIGHLFIEFREIHASGNNVDEFVEILIMEIEQDYPTGSGIIESIRKLIEDNRRVIKLSSFNGTKKIDRLN